MFDRQKLVTDKNPVVSGSISESQTGYKEIGLLLLIPYEMRK